MVLDFIHDARVKELTQIGLTQQFAEQREVERERLRAPFGRGGVALAEKVARYSPLWVAFVGIGAYSTAFGCRKVAPGPQVERVGASRIWVLPNTSGLNAHYTPARVAEVFRELRVAAFGGS